LLLWARARTMLRWAQIRPFRSMNRHCAGALGVYRAATSGSFFPSFSHAFGMVYFCCGAWVWCCDIASVGFCLGVDVMACYALPGFGLVSVWSLARFRHGFHQVLTKFVYSLGLGSARCS
jgi:hypothetical protein